MWKKPLLDDRQIHRLGQLFGRWASSEPWRAPLVAELEPAYTREVILPSASAWLAGINKPELFLRADGGVAPRPVSGYGTYFYPDLEISAHTERYLAAEVKFIRDSDPSGSISKAIGQAIVYRAAGIPMVYVLLIDCRAGGRSQADVDGVFAELGQDFDVHAVYRSFAKTR